MNPLDTPRCCPHCGNTTPHVVLFQSSAPQTWYDSDGEPTEDRENRAPGLDYAILRCTTCQDISLFSKLEFDDWDLSTLRYPSDYNLDPCVPTVVASNYREAKRVQNISPNAFAVLLRRALEAMCDDRGVSRGNLASRLRDLAAKGEIPGKLAEISSVLRELGNAAAHYTAQRVTVPLTWTMDEFFRTLIEYVYVAPHKLVSFQKRLTKYERSERGAAPNPSPATSSSSTEVSEGPPSVS